MTKQSPSGGLAVRRCCGGLAGSGQGTSISPVTLQALLRKTVPREAAPNPHSGPRHTHKAKLWGAPENIQIRASCGCFQGPAIISRTHQWLHKTHRPPSALCLCGLYLGSSSAAPCMVENQTDKRLHSHYVPSAFRRPRLSWARSRENRSCTRQEQLRLSWGLYHPQVQPVPGSLQHPFSASFSSNIHFFSEVP